MLSELKNFSILYVEDEPEIQENIAEYLESYFKVVYTASDGEEGYASYKKYFPDVLLLDINIPKMDGLALAKKIRETDDNVKILMLTAHTQTDKLLLATELKLTKYLVKPVSPRAFKEALIVLKNELSRVSKMFLELGQGYLWNISCEVLLKDGIEVSLTEKEHRLLKLLISKKSEVISYLDIIIMVWEDAYDREVSIDSVKNQVRNLRQKLPSGIIDSVYGKGYLLR